jgi:hypothetical protein
MPDVREERIARNEALFRIANERMAAWEEQHEAEESEYYFCECADPDCREKALLSRAEYERVRADAGHFLVIPGHEIPDVETVIEAHDGWVIIEKDPGVRPIVEDMDTRRRR